MKSTILAIAIALTATSAFAAPTGSAYDRIQDERMNGQWSEIKDHQIKIDTLVQVAGDHETRITDLENRPAPKDGVDGKDGRDGTNGIDGKDGQNGLDGKDGINGKDGVDGKNGTDGANGRDGVDGAPGKDGAKGDTGATGSAGTNGTDGRNGTDGANGKDADMTSVNAQINAATQHSNQQFASLKQQIDDNHKKANAGSASAMAAAGVPQVTGNQTFTLGAAVGGYESENAIAVGASYRASESVTLKATVAADTQQGFGYNAGIAIGW